MKAPTGFAPSAANAGGHTPVQLFRLSSSGNSSPGGYGLINPAVFVVGVSVQLEAFFGSPVTPFAHRGVRPIIERHSFGIGEHRPIDFADLHLKARRHRHVADRPRARGRVSDDGMRHQQSASGDATLAMPAMFVMCRMASLDGSGKHVANLFGRAVRLGAPRRVVQLENLHGRIAQRVLAVPLPSMCRPVLTRPPARPAVNIG